MVNRAFDFIVSFFGLVVSAPFLSVILFLVWWEDKHSPFYIAPRIGKDEEPFNMVKIRTMVVGADKTGVDSTSANDQRITKVGQFVRKYKIDELMQLWNVLKGDISLVGPRPQVKRDVDLYTEEEKKLLSARPGITDFASIVFSDEGEILRGKENPDLAYNQLIRPWKSRLGLFYINNRSILLDIKLIFLTIISIMSRIRALKRIQYILKRLGADNKLVEIAGREVELTPHPPPGSTDIVTER